MISVGAIAIKGLNLGIDFEGGTKITFTTPQPASLEDVRSRGGEDRPGRRADPGQGRRRSAADSYRAFQIRTESLEQRSRRSLTTDLHAARSTAESIGVKNVSASFGRQIAEGAILAIFVSLLLVVIYIAFRFQPKFAGPVMVALLHDVLITVGIYALLGREVTTATVAAVLTVLGYSIYDTIIILDRIRENMPLMKRASFRVMANVSLWETIPRSLATTFITLLPITALYFFGGETLKDFALRAARRHRRRCLLVDLHRRAARRGAEGARAGVRAPPRRRWTRGRRVGRRPARRRRRRSRPRSRRPT